MDDLSSLEDVEITRRLAAFIEELEELEEERDFVLKQTGLHLPGATVKHYEAQTEKFRESIKALQAETKRRGL